MRHTPNMNNEYERADAEAVRGEPWMIDCLTLNPEGGAHEDHAGWRTWPEVDLKLNEVVDFYFHVERDRETCKVCDRTGLNDATRALDEAFYGYTTFGPFGLQRLLPKDMPVPWEKHLTDDEVAALIEAGRRPRPDGSWSHDGINRAILVGTRARRFGVYGKCPRCGGRGELYTEESGHLSLTLWLLGASRGVEVKVVQREELPAIFAFLRQAAERNAERFAKVPLAAKP